MFFIDRHRAGRSVSLGSGGVDEALYTVKHGRLAHIHHAVDVSIHVTGRRRVRIRDCDKGS